MQYIEIVFSDLPAPMNEVLVAQLSAMGFHGFEEDGNKLKSYIDTDAFDKNSFDYLIQEYSINYTKSIIKETNWNEKWESGFEPVSVSFPGKENVFAHIRADFHPVNGASEFELVITPKMSFGTGHHATTHLMIEQMSGIGFSDKRVVDFGTGTGLLAILAEKMGAGSVLAIDNDEWSIMNAKENVAANGCSKIELVQADYCTDQGSKADILLANINLNIIKSNLAAIKNCCKKPSVLLFSGILSDDLEDIKDALAAEGIPVSAVFERNNWLCLSSLLT